eukprot:Partr_v1_DN26958_c0_g1_i4_m7017 putative pelota homolog
MKLIKRYLEKDRSGYLVLCPDDPEDMWHIYNLAVPGDKLRATTFRRLQTVSSTGSTDSQRVRITITIAVESMDFDASTCSIRVNGKVVEENEHVKMGAYHTIDLELHRNLTITKEEWDSIALDRIATACDITKRAEIAAVVLQDGLANVCLLTENMTIVRQRIEVSITKKRKGSNTQYEKSVARFHEQIYEAIARHVDFAIVKVLILASPGFYKDSLYQYLVTEAVRRANRPFQENKNKILLMHSSTGHKGALQEVLRDPSIQTQLADTKYAKETKALESFFQMLNDNPDRAYYGLKHVSKAAEMGAISTLLLTDSLFRSSDVITRKKHIALADHCKKMGATVHIFSSLHTSGERESIIINL